VSAAAARVAAGVVCLLLAGGCLRNPVSNRRQARLISEASERQIGAKTRESLVQQYGQVEDPALQAYVSKVGLRLAAVSDRPRLDYVFTVLDSGMVNAFAAPGGFIFVTRGLLERMETEAELASVLGHEIGHVCAWHSVTMIQKQMGAGVLALLGTVAAGMAAGPEASIAMLQTAGLFTDLYLLGYSRENELEADRVGLRYALSAGYDAAASIVFFRRIEALDAQAGAEEWEPYLRSHPKTADRVTQAEAYLSKMSPFHRPPPETAGEFPAYRRRLLGTAPEELGRAEGTLFRHEGFGVSLRIPDGWSWEVHNQQILASFRAPTGGGWGELRRHRVEEGVSLPAFVQRSIAQRRWKPLQGREALYPAGYVYLGGFVGEGPMGEGYQLRVLFLVRGGAGYILVCGSPADKFTDFLLPFETIMRSFRAA
jgi:predicted Zn-dependent protease